MSTSPRPKQRIHPGHYLVYGIYRGIEFLLKLLPMHLVCLFGAALGHIAYLVLAERRQTVTRNLRIAFGREMDIAAIRKLTRQTFHRTGANLIASVRTAALPPDEIVSRIEIKGQQNLIDARKSGHGIIGLLGHMGNWELLAQAHLALPELVPTATLYRPIDNPLIDALIVRRRGSQGTAVFSRRDGFFKPISHLKQKGSLGILADQQAGTHGLAVPLFGKLTSMTNLPAIMHRRTGASIVPISMSATSQGHWQLTVLPAITIPAELASDTVRITSLCAQAYETSMRSSPADVFWMHGYWKVGRKRPLKIDGLQKKRTGAQRSAATQPFHVMVYTGAATPSDHDTHEQLNRLKHYRPDLQLTTIGENRFEASDHWIPARSSDTSPRLIHQIEEYELAQTAPVDCALDFTPQGHGAALLTKAGIPLAFARQGPYLSQRSANYLSKCDHPTLADFLDSLGIDD